VLETYSAKGIRFYAPATAYAEAEKYLQALLNKRGEPNIDAAAALTNLRGLVNTIEQEEYTSFEDEARLRLKGRDEDDWHVLAAALSMA
jgi:hypothetical protein